MAGSKRGRKSAYDEKIKPRFKDIEKWLKGGASEKQVAEAIGVSEATWFKYKAENTEFKEFIKSINRSEIVCDLRSALLKKAMGYTYEEKKQYIKEDTDTGKKYKYTEITTKTSHPDVAAINLALKNYDRDNWANDPQMLELKKQELELRKQIAEDKAW